MVVVRVVVGAGGGVGMGGTVPVVVAAVVVEPVPDEVTDVGNKEVGRGWACDRAIITRIKIKMQLKEFFWKLFFGFILMV